MQQHGTLDGVYENIELISGSANKKLREGKDLAYLSKKLAEIWCDAPVDLDLKALDVHDRDLAEVARVLKKLEFKSLLRSMPELAAIEPSSSDGSEAEVQTVAPRHIINAEQLEQVKINYLEPVVLASRCSGSHGKMLQILVIGQGKNAYVLHLNKLSTKDVTKKLFSIFSVEEKLHIIGYDLKSTIQALYGLRVHINEISHDVFIGAFLINSLRREQTLCDLAFAELGYECASFENNDDEEFASRAGEMVGIIRALHKQQLVELAKMPKVEAVGTQIEWPVIPVLARMEYKGIELDTAYLEAFNTEVTDQISDLEQLIYGHAEKEFNISSPAQLAEVLFVDLALPTAGVKKGKTGYSTAAAELDRLRPLHPIVELVSQYREVVKLKNTYIDALPRQVDDTSRVHTTFNLTIAQTGRLSSTDPNLQNIPVRTELGRRIRTAFVAGEGKVLVSADYSQFELRLAAALANDQELIDMFNKDLDVHTATAAQVYGRDPEEVTKQMRRDAKVINFGILYGMSPHGLSAATGMTIVAAKQFIDKYFELRKPILNYMNGLKELARSQGYIETLFGRRRPTPDIHAGNFIVRQAAERAAINMPIQGTEADIMKLAMVEVEKKLPKNADMLLQIHDSILVECKEADAEQVVAIMKETMQDIYKLPVKITVDTTVGKNWGEL